jgi:hypothetical protein
MNYRLVFVKVFLNIIYLSHKKLTRQTIILLGHKHLKVIGRTIKPIELDKFRNIHLGILIIKVFNN